MIELLRLCGFTEHDINAQLPRVEKAFGKLGITTEDIERGKQRLNKYYDVKLAGVQKAFRLCILELLNSVLAREEGKKKIIFSFMAPGIETIGTALMSKSRDILVCHHSWAFLLVMGCIFDKLVRILEAAESKWLKSGVAAHCANVKTMLGIIELDMIPKPDLMISTGFLCETAPKTLDLLHELYDMPIFCWDTCYDSSTRDDSNIRDKADDLAAKSLKALVAKIQDLVGFEITDDMLWEALEAKSRFNSAIGKAQKIIHNSDPLPLSPTHDNLWMILSSLTLSIDDYAEAIDVADTLYREVEERVNKGLGVMEKGAPRVLGEVFAHHGDPRLEHLAYEMGIAVMVATPASTLHSDGKFRDPYAVMSMGMGGSLGASFSKKIPLQIETCKRMKLDGVLDRYHVGCRAVAGDALVLEKAFKKAGIPVLLLEWENFDPRVYNQQEYRNRLEAFKTMLTAKEA